MEATYTFVSTLVGDKPIICESFRDAFIQMYNWVTKYLQKGDMSYQVLETAIWIEDPSGNHTFFYDARDRAIQEGVMKDGGGLIEA